jgi:hypothetical protein
MASVYGLSAIESASRIADFPWPFSAAITVSEGWRSMLQDRKRLKLLTVRLSIRSDVLLAHIALVRSSSFARS